MDRTKFISLPLHKIGPSTDTSSITFWITTKDHSVRYEDWAKYQADLYDVTGYAIQGPVIASREVVVGYAEGKVSDLKQFSEKIAGLNSKYQTIANISQFQTILRQRYQTFDMFAGFDRTYIGFSNDSQITTVSIEK